jgi:hypothetical protein
MMNPTVYLGGVITENNGKCDHLKLAMPNTLVQFVIDYRVLLQGLGIP